MSVHLTRYKQLRDIATACEINRKILLYYYYTDVYAIFCREIFQTELQTVLDEGNDNTFLGGEFLLWR